MTAWSGCAYRLHTGSNCGTTGSKRVTLDRAAFRLALLIIVVVTRAGAGHRKTAAKIPMNTLPLASIPYFTGVFRQHDDIPGLLATFNLSAPILAKVAKPARKCLLDGAFDVCDIVARALLNHFRTRAKEWHVVSHTYSYMRSVSTADLAVSNTTTKFGGAASPRTVTFGTTGINWTHNPFWDVERDAEWAWGLHRQPFWMSLAYAYTTTSNEQYFDAWSDQVATWIADCPRDPFYNYDWGLAWELKPSNQKHMVSKSRTWPNPVHPELSWAWRRVDAGRRGLQFPELLQAFLPSPHFSPRLLIKVLRSIHEHGEFLAQNPYHDFTRDNHGLFEAEGAAALGILFPEFSSAEQWRARSFQLMQREMRTQVRVDGMQIENSVAYHAATIRILTDTPVLAEENGLTGFPSWYWLRVRRMLEALSALAFPTGLSVQFGDQASRLNVSGVLSRLGPLVATKTGGSPLSSFGHTGQLRTVRLPYSGFFSIHGGVGGPDGTMFVLRCGPSYNAHTHKDAGTFELAAWGQMLLSDPGCFTYNGIKEREPTDERRRYFQGTAAHQTLTLDRRDAHLPSLEHGPFQVLKGYDDCGTLLWESGHDHAVLVIENRDTYRDPDLSHRRAVVYFAKQNVFVIVDDAIGPATGLVEVHFHTESNDTIHDSNSLTARTTSTGRPNVLIKGTPTPGINVSLQTGQRSPTMGKSEPRSSVSFAFNKKTALPVRFVTVIAPYAPGEEPPTVVASTIEPAGSSTVTVTLHDKTEAKSGGRLQLVQTGMSTDTVEFSIDPDNMQMAPPPHEFRQHAETRYARFYNNFRQAQLPLRNCSSACFPHIPVEGNETHITDARRSLVFVPAKKYLYCGIPKCGVSRWRRLSRRVSNVTNWADNNAHNSHTNGLNYIAKVARSSSKKSAETLLNDPGLHSFVIVRSPYARLLSSWLDKKDFPNFRLPQTFDAFVKWVVNRADYQLNEHFAPMTSFCGITEGVRFDAVYKLEAMSTWGPELVAKLNLTDAVATGWRGGFFRSSNFSHNHFSDKRLTEFYTDELMMLIAERYRDDFEVFGYDPEILE